jgi:predicted MFS family arabinose efflux permease
VRRGLAPLRHRGFRLLAGGQLASNLGDAFYMVALPWYVLSHHGGALLLGSVLACYGVSRTASLVVGGHLSDRLRPWTVMLSTDIARAILIGALVLVVATRPPSLAVLAPIAVLVGVGDGFFIPCSFPIIPALLPDEDLRAGNALSSGWTQLALLVGPALGGGVVAVLGPAPAFAVDAASFLVSAITLSGVRRAAVVATGSPAADERTDDLPFLWDVIRAERVFRLIFAITLVANLTSGGLSEVALPALAHGPLHAGSTGYGVLMAAFGAGALAGTIVAGQSPRFTRPAVVASCGFIGQCAFIVAVPYLGGTVPAAVMLAGFGALNGFSNVLTLTAFQRWARPEMLGRLSGVLMLGSLGTFPVSVLVGGIVVHALGPAILFPLSGVSVAATVLGSLCFRAWREFGATDRAVVPARAAIPGARS